MKVLQYCGAEIGCRSQRAHYYKSARLEKVASPVKKNEKQKNEKLLLELLHPEWRFLCSVPPTLRHLLRMGPKSPFPPDIAAVQEPGDWGALGRI
jgi:hypothetical protein